MKYLRKINESSVDELKRSIENYLLDLAGLKTSVTSGYDGEIWIRIWNSSSDWNYHDSKDFDFQSIYDELSRAFIFLRADHKFEIEYVYTIKTLNGDITREQWTKEEFLELDIDDKIVKCFFICLKP